MLPVQANLKAESIQCRRGSLTAPLYCLSTPLSGHHVHSCALPALSTKLHANMSDTDGVYGSDERKSGTFGWLALAGNLPYAEPYFLASKFRDALRRKDSSQSHPAI